MLHIYILHIYTHKLKWNWSYKFQEMFQGRDNNCLAVLWKWDCDRRWHCCFFTNEIDFVHFWMRHFVFFVSQFWPIPEYEDIMRVSLKLQDYFLYMCMESVGNSTECPCRFDGEAWFNDRPNPWLKLVTLRITTGKCTGTLVPMNFDKPAAGIFSARFFSSQRGWSSKFCKAIPTHGPPWSLMVPERRQKGHSSGSWRTRKTH